uniref:Uncharacterized protein n=1 Tax=Pelusios castaneus TaxID=367368 RepID=A0A8C8S8K0_9SAUR
LLKQPLSAVFPSSPKTVHRVRFETMRMGRWKKSLSATPMDVIKSRMQVANLGQHKYRGLIHCIRTSVREEGIRVLFKGLGLNCIRAFPVNMMVFVTYEGGCDDLSTWLTWIIAAQQPPKGSPSAGLIGSR